MSRQSGFSGRGHSQRPQRLSQRRDSPHGPWGFKNPYLANWESKSGRERSYATVPHTLSGTSKDPRSSGSLVKVRFFEWTLNQVQAVRPQPTRPVRPQPQSGRQRNSTKQSYPIALAEPSGTSVNQRLSLGRANPLPNGIRKLMGTISAADDPYTKQCNQPCRTCAGRARRQHSTSYAAQE